MSEPISGRNSLLFAMVFCGVTRHFEKYPEGPGDEVGLLPVSAAQIVKTRDLVPRSRFGGSRTKKRGRGRERRKRDLAKYESKPALIGCSMMSAKAPRAWFWAMFTWMKSRRFNPRVQLCRSHTAAKTKTHRRNFIKLRKMYADFARPLRNMRKDTLYLAILEGLLGSKA